jgi:hypothetical protein
MAYASECLQAVIVGSNCTVYCVVKNLSLYMILARCTRRAANCLKDLSHIASNMQQDVPHLPLGYQHLLAIQEERRGFAMTFSKDAECNHCCGASQSECCRDASAIHSLTNYTFSISGTGVQ